MKTNAGEEVETAADVTVPQTQSSTDSTEPLVILVHSDGTAIDALPSSSIPSHSTSPVAPVVTFIQQQGEELHDMVSSASSLVDPEQTVVLTAGDDGNMSSFLDTLPLDTDVGPDQRVALFQAENGQIVCLTYAVASGNGEELQEVNVAEGLDMNTANSIVGLDIEDGLQEHFILNGLNEGPLTVTSGASGDLQISDTPCDDKDVDNSADQVLAKLRLEDRLRMLEQLLPPITSRIRPSPTLSKTPPPDSDLSPTPTPPPPLLRTLTIAATPGVPPKKNQKTKPLKPPRSKDPPPLRPRPPQQSQKIPSPKRSSSCTPPPPMPATVPAAPAAVGAPPPLYVCDLCGACFERPAQFYGHLHRHKDEREYRCALCPGPGGSQGLEFASAAQLRAHQHQYHPAGRPHACTLCPARFYRASQLTYHIRRDHAGERSHLCALCPKAFFKRSDLRTHLNVHLGIHKSVCETCGRRFGHVSNLIRHARTHSGVRPYPCPECGRRFGQLNAMLQHRFSHEAERRVPCPTCGRLYKTVPVMRKHARAAHGTFLPPSQGSSGNPSSGAPPVKTEGKDACAATAGDAGVACPADRRPAPRARKFYCAACGATFKYSALLRQHEMQHEAAAAQGDLSCAGAGCGRTFRSVDEFKQHACIPPGDPLDPAFPLATVASKSQPETPRPPPRPPPQTTPPPPQSTTPQQPHSAVSSPPLPESSSATLPSLSVNSDETPQLTALLGLRKSHDHVVSENQRLLESLLMEDVTASEVLEGNREELKIGSGTELSTITTGSMSATMDVMKGVMSSIKTGDMKKDACEGNIVVLISSGTDLNGFNESRGDGGGTNSSKTVLVLKPRSALLPLMPDQPLPALSSDSTPSTSLLSDIKCLQDHSGKTTTDSLNSSQPVEGSAECSVVFNSAVRHKGNRSFRCSECGKVFHKSGNYKQHLGMHFVDKKNHKCLVCGMLFAWKSTLNKHVARMHPDGTAPPRPHCEHCGRDYATVAQIQDHIRRDHFLQRPHACSVPTCTKRFYKKHDLKVHLRMHNKERPYICGSCGKTFYHLSHIIRHERIHTGLRPYECSDCGRHFNQSSTLKSHRKRHREKEQLQLQQHLQLQLQLQQQEEHQKEIEKQLLQNDDDDDDDGVVHEGEEINLFVEPHQLEPGGLEEVELDPPTLENQRDTSSLLPSPKIGGEPPEPLVELTVTDAEMVLGLPNGVMFSQGLFPDVT